MVGQIICERDWYETEDHKTGWDCTPWVDENRDTIFQSEYELIQVLDTDKYDRPTKAIFKLI